MKLKKQIKIRKMKNLFESKNYNSIMFVLMISVSLLIVFNIVDTFDNLNNTNIKEIKPAITGNIISEEDLLNKIENNSNETTNDSYSYYNDSRFEKPELYQFKSNFVFYLMLIVLVAIIIIVAIILRSTIIENIKLEYMENSSLK